MSDDLTIPNPGFAATRGANRPVRHNTSAARRKPGIDSGTKQLMMFAGGVGGLLAVLIGASALNNRHSGQVPVVVADPSPIRIKPANPGGLKVDAAENDVFSGGLDNKNAKLAPAAEAPDTKALQAVEEDEDQPKAKPSGSTALVRAAPLLGDASSQPPPAPTPVKPPQAGTTASVKPVSAVAAKPPQLADAHTAASKPAPAAEVHAATQKPEVPSANGHKVMVQLAAMATDTAARDEWLRMSKRYPDLLGGHELAVSKTERDNQTFWRVRTGGFPDAAQARAFCERLRAKGAGCSVIEF